MTALDLQDRFGEIDIYLFDQLLRGRITPGMRVLDAGCGTGRNLVYLLQSGVDVFATDQSAAAAGRCADRSLEDHRGAEPTGDDDLGRAQGPGGRELTEAGPTRRDGALRPTAIHLARRALPIKSNDS